MRWLMVSVLIAALGCRSCPSDPASAFDRAATVRERQAFDRAATVRERLDNRTPNRSLTVAAQTSPSPDILPCSAAVGQEGDDSPELPAPARLEQPPEADQPLFDGQPLTLTQLEQLALRRNPTVPEAAALIQQQQGITRQAGLYPNPTAGYVRTDADQSGQSQTSGVFLSQTVITAGKLSLGRQFSRLETQARRWQLTAQQIRVLNDLRIRFFEVLGAQRAVEAAKEQVRLAEEGQRAAEQLLKAKRGSRPDVLQAGMELGLVRTALQEAEARYQSAWRQLANVIGVFDLPSTPLVGRLEDGIPNLDEKKELQRLLEASPLLKAQEKAIEADRYELKLAKAQAVPDLNVQVVAQRDHILKYSNVTTLVSMPVPIFNRNQGNIINAQGTLRQAVTEYQRLRLALSDLLAVSFRNYRTFRARAERLQKEVLPQAEENLDLTMQGYKAQHLDFLHAQNARRMYFQANIEYIDALTELHKVVVEIEGLQLTGGLNPTEIGTALQAMPGVPSGVRSVLLQQIQQGRGATRNLPGAVQAAEK